MPSDWLASPGCRNPNPPSAGPASSPLCRYAPLMKDPGRSRWELSARLFACSINHPGEADFRILAWNSWQQRPGEGHSDGVPTGEG